MRALAHAKGRRWWGVGLASVALHAALGLLVLADLGRAPPTSALTPAAAVEIWLAAKPPVARPPARPATQSRREARERPARQRAVASAPPTDSAAASPTDGGEPLQPAPAAPLRRLTGCRLAMLDQLAPEARARCLERLAVLARSEPRLNLDLTGRYARDQTPYLARPPKNGCKPVAGVKNSVNGTVDAKVGVGCAFSF